ncbi:hypothetical protein CBR_g37449 [Chara braunii]|uniref:Uncharacterized protein n=1 Tax=Chara braunii TaxID=69332 RepID=A0A388LMU6_CHABU|nr:hypothetical protein CBR_g37449 [Chara braunii]|eukprot:GBG83647.1 hypothetical protein CBR_g37449 [Chara braunii]
MDYIYYSLLTGGLRWGDERLQLIELVRSKAPTPYRDWSRKASSEWRHPPLAYVWDLLDRELRARPEYIASVGRLFVDDWDAWWSDALISPQLIVRYYESIGASRYALEPQIDDGDVDDEEAWEPDWVDADEEDSESEDEIEEVEEVDGAAAGSIHFPRLVRKRGVEYESPLWVGMTQSESVLYRHRRRASYSLRWDHRGSDSWRSVDDRNPRVIVQEVVLRRRLPVDERHQPSSRRLSYVSMVPRRLTRDEATLQVPLAVSIDEDLSDSECGELAEDVIREQRLGALREITSQRWMIYFCVRGVIRVEIVQDETPVEARARM